MTTSSDSVLEEPPAEAGGSSRCANGHEKVEPNGYWKDAPGYKGGRRWICRLCARNWQTKYKGRSHIPDDVPIAPKNKDKTHCPQGHAYAEHGRQNANGTRSCRECQKTGRKMRAYGLSKPEIDRLLEITCCEICGEEKEMHIDHDHTTGEVRGVLCSNCNNGIGRFKDDPARLKAAVKYLSRRRK